MPSKTQRLTLFAFAAALTGIAILSPFAAMALPTLPTCTQLAAKLTAMSDITSATSATVAAGGGNAAYCNVQITVSNVSGPAGGYLPGQKQQIEIGIGLPLSAADGGTGGVQGAWNQRIQNLGGGGYAGAVGSTTAATNFGYAGSSTDTGHEDPTGGGTFALNPDDTLNRGLIEDFAYRGIHNQTIWTKKLVQMYYGTNPKFTYWNGCSTGGRQGHQQAQRFPDDYDGILAGSNAFNWDRFIPAELWGEVVMNQEVGAPIAAAKLNDVSQAVLAQCDPLDGITDGIIQDPRACLVDANNYVCGQPGVSQLTSASDCLTPQEASAMNKIWNGLPGPQPDQREWFGLERGAVLDFLDGAAPFPISTQWFQYWVFKDPAFDWHTLTEKSFAKAFTQSEDNFHQVIGTDNPDLSAFKAHGARMITFHGLSDIVIFPRGTYNYYNRVTQAMGGLAATQKFYRFFPFPGNAHCALQPTFSGNAPEIDLTTNGPLFQALVNWVEHGVAPSVIIASNPGAPSPGTRPICMYPNTLQYNGGNAFNAANFSCVTQTSDELMSAEKTLPDPGK